MFDIGWSELLLVAVLAIIFVGPKDLPKLMRTLGQYTAKMRAMAREFQNSFEDLARETEIEELRKQMAELREGAMKPLADMQQSAEVIATATKAPEQTLPPSEAPTATQAEPKEAGPV